MVDALQLAVICEHCALVPAATTGTAGAEIIAMSGDVYSVFPLSRNQKAPSTTTSLRKWSVPEEMTGVTILKVYIPVPPGAKFPAFTLAMLPGGEP